MLQALTTIRGALYALRPLRASRWFCALLVVAAAWSDLRADEKAHGWPMHRGDPGLTGVSKVALPGELVVKWKFDAKEAIASSAAIAGGLVFFGADSGALHCLDFADGAQRWALTTSGPIQSSPLVHQNLVIVGNDEGDIIAADVATGVTRWTVKTQGQVISSPTTDGSSIFVGSYEGSVLAIAPRDGRVLWTYKTDGKIHGTVSIAGEAALVAGCDEKLHVFQKDRGEGIRRIPLGSVSGSSAAVLGDVVFVGTYGNQVRAVNWRTGETKWVFEDPDRQFPFVGSAAVTDSAVVIGGRDKTLRAFEPATGKIRWSFMAKGRIDSSPVISGRFAYFGSSDGNLYAIAMDDGRKVWSYDAGAPIVASAAVAGGALLIGTQDGLMLRFDPK